MTRNAVFHSGGSFDDGSPITSFPSAVASVFGRTGSIVAVTGDYYGAVAAALTGATQASRYVGATASGAPVSGTFVKGDWVVAQDGHIFVCTSGGTPGTWIDIGGGGGGVTYGTPAIALGTAAAAGSIDEAIRRDATIVAFDTTDPSTQAFGDAAAVGVAAVGSRRDHKHAMPAAPTAASVGADVAGAAAAAQAASQPLDSDLTAIAALDASTSGAIASDGAGWIKKTYAQFKTALSLVKGDVGLGNVDNTADSSKSVASAAALTTPRAIDGQTFDGTAAITVIAPGTHAATSKATPVDADELPLVDSAAANVLKKLTWANLKATLKTYFDTLYPSGSGTSTGTNTGDVAFATNAVVLGTAAAAGAAATVMRSNDTIAAFDGTSPTTQAIGDAAAVGVAAVAARRDHKHGMPAFATPAIVLGSAAAAGSAATLVRSDGTIAAFDTTVPSTQAFADAAAVGVAAFAARRDHKHAMPANPLALALAGSTYYFAPSGQLTTNAPGTGNLLCRAIWLPAGVTLDRIGCEVTGNVANAVVRLGLYADAGWGYPGALVTDYGTVDAASSNGNKEINISTLISTAGLYWLGAAMQTAGATMRAVTTPQYLAFSSFATAPSGSNTGVCYKQGSVTSGLPNPFAGTDAGATVATRVYVRIT